MTRLLNLILFEMKKILNNKKAFLFLLVLNVVPIVSSLVLLIAYISCKGLGFGEIQFIVMKRIVQSIFTAHFTIFGYSAPFFLALIVGDSFSTEFGKGYMKMLLITPVKRWQVITAKTFAIIVFLSIAVILGGVILQSDLFISKSITQPSVTLPNSFNIDTLDTSISLINFSSALQLLILCFIANMMMIGFFIVFSMFFESAILMSFCSICAVMFIHVLYWSTSLLNELVKWFVFFKHICFTRHFTSIFDITIIRNILEGKMDLTSSEVYTPIIFCCLWSIGFYVLSMYIFSRKQVLH